MSFPFQGRYKLEDEFPFSRTSWKKRLLIFKDETSWKMSFPFQGRDKLEEMTSLFSGDELKLRRDKSRKKLDDPRKLDDRRKASGHESWMTLGS